MPIVTKSCSIFNAFNHERTNEEDVGFITSLKIAEITPSVDLSLEEPINDGKVKSVAAISQFDWEGGYAQPLNFTFNVSVDNKNKIASLIHNQMKSIKVEIEFQIFTYDYNNKAFYKSVWTDAAIKGVIQVQGTERVFYLDDKPGMEVQQPLNYQIVLGIQPEDIKQTIHVAISQTDKFAKQWGVERTTK